MVDGITEEYIFGNLSFSDANINNSEEENDEWGDFVKSPIKYPISNNDNNNPLLLSAPLPLSLFGQIEDVGSTKHNLGYGSHKNTKNGKLNYNGSRSDKDGKGMNFELFGENCDNPSSVRIENGSGLRSDSGMDNRIGGKGENGFGFSQNSNGIRSDLNEDGMNCGLFGKSGDDRSSVPIENVSGLSSVSGTGNQIRGKGVYGSSFSRNSNEIRSDLNGEGMNFESFGGNYGNHSVPIENVSGLHSDSIFFAKSRDFPSLGNGDLSGLSSNLDMFQGNNLIHSPQVKDFNGLIFISDLFNVKNGDHTPQMKDTIVPNLNSDALFPINSGHSRIETDLFIRHNGNNLVGLHSNLSGLVSSTVLPSGNKDFDADDNDWEFKDAYSEWKVGNGIDNKVEIKHQESSKVVGISTQAVNGSHGSINFSSASNGMSAKPMETDFNTDFTQSAVAQKGFSLHKPEIVAQNGLSSDSFFNSKRSGFDGGLDSDPLDSNEWFGNFHGATGNELMEKDVPKTGNTSHSEAELPTSNGKGQGNETSAKNHNQALPLALFGDEELESDDSLSAQEEFSYKPSSTQRAGINSEGSNHSIHDLISNLYSQSQQNSSVENPEKLTGNALNLKPSDEVLSHIPGNIDEDFDDDSWEFKDASAGTHALELSSHLVFYHKLEEQLSFVCRCHLDNLKKARDTAAFSSEDAKVTEIEEEFQEACKELQGKTSYFAIHLDNQAFRETSLNEFLEVLHEPKFKALESQYQLTRKLHSAQKDLRSAIDAMKHTKSKLNILTIGSSEDQYNYVSTWYKIISVCAQELKHGSWIWKQSIESNLQREMVSDPRGKDFIISLAEIYRVIIILRASTKLFEPWILSNSTGIHSLFEDCCTVWSSLRIEEALDLLVHNEYQNTAKALLESIKRIHDLDELALQDLVFRQQVSTCRLSLLSSKVIPEMNMVTCNGETYFVTLANLWVNLVSCDLPDLPRLQVAS